MRVRTTNLQDRMHLSRLFHPWLSMVLAIIFELIGTINTKASSGVTKLLPSVTMFMSYAFCALFLALALDVSTPESLDLGVAYATWSGIGTIAAAFAGICLYEESLDFLQWIGIILTIVGVSLVNISHQHLGVNNNIEKSAIIVEDASQYGSIENSSVLVAKVA